MQRLTAWPVTLHLVVLLPSKARGTGTDFPATRGRPCRETSRCKVLIRTKHLLESFRTYQRLTSTLKVRSSTPTSTTHCARFHCCARVCCPWIFYKLRTCAREEVYSCLHHGKKSSQVLTLRQARNTPASYAVQTPVRLPVVLTLFTCCFSCNRTSNLTMLALSYRSGSMCTKRSCNLLKAAHKLLFELL
jgi:hypothetical protein